MLHKLAEFIGNVARPFAIIWTALCGGVAMIVASWRVENGNDGGVLIGAVGLIVTGIYLGKAWEVARVAKSDAEVKIAEAGK